MSTEPTAAPLEGVVVRNGSTGRYQPSYAAAEEHAEWLRLRQQGLSYYAIAKRVDRSEATVRQAITKRMRDVVEEPAAELRSLELARLDTLWQQALAIMAAQHPLVSNGRVIRDDSGQPMLDDMPKLAAIDRLLRIQDRRAKLMGLDAQVKVDLRVSDGVDRDIERFAAEAGLMAELAAAAEVGAAGGDGEAAS